MRSNRARLRSVGINTGLWAWALFTSTAGQAAEPAASPWEDSSANPSTPPLETPPSPGNPSSGANQGSPFGPPAASPPAGAPSTPGPNADAANANNPPASASPSNEPTPVAGPVAEPVPVETQAEPRKSTRRRRERRPRAAKDTGAAPREAAVVSVGRPEPSLNTLRGPMGLFYTMLPGTGGKNTWRLRIHTDFFRKTKMFCCGNGNAVDEHTRIRGSFNFGWGITDWLETYFAIHNQANRNVRVQTTRYDPETIFALGDIGFGFKGGYNFLDGGVGMGLHVGMSLLTGTEKLTAAGVQFSSDAIFAVDLRHLTRAHAPVRFGVNFGWLLDNSHQLIDWSDIPDNLSREVMRFGTGADHSRLRTRVSVDFPIRFGPTKAHGIDPSIEWTWNRSTHEDPDFAGLVEEEKQAKHSQSWLTVGVRANVYDGLHVDAGADLGLLSPNFEFGSRVPQWQVILGLGWSIAPGRGASRRDDATDFVTGRYGRVVGRVVGENGQAIAGAQVSFPGTGSNTLLTDASGVFSSIRFEPGIVSVRITAPGSESAETTVEIVAGEDSSLEVELGQSEDATSAEPDDTNEKPEDKATAAVGTLEASIKDPEGRAVSAEIYVRGDGIDESHLADELGTLQLELPVGQYTVELRADGYVGKTLSVRVLSEGLRIDETLDPSAQRSAEPEPAVDPGERPSYEHVSAKGKRIRVRRKIRYSGHDLHSSAPALLDQLAALLVAAPEYRLVEIQVHTDDRPGAMARSKARAEAVIEYLVGRGVDASRLVAKGRGDRTPVAVNLTPEGRRKNNRTYVVVRDYQP